MNPPPVARLIAPASLAAACLLGAAFAQAAERPYYRNVNPSAQQPANAAPGTGSNNGGTTPTPAPTPIALTVSQWPASARDLDAVSASFSTANAGGPVTYTVQGLPNNLTYSAGKVTGQFVGAGSGTVVVTATDGVTSDTKTLPYVVHPRVPQVAVNAPAGPIYPGDLFQASAYSTNSVSPLTWTLASSPTWLTIDATTGAVNGRPPSGDTSFTFTPQADNGYDPAVAANPVTVPLLKTLGPKFTGTIPTALTAYTALPTLAVNSDGGVDPVKLVATGNVPPGITVNQAGPITGTPYQAGSYTYTLTLVDAASPAHSYTVGTYTTVVSNPTPTYDLAAADKALSDFKAAMAARGFIYTAMSGGGGSAANKDYRRQIPAAFSSDSAGKLVMTDAAMRASAYQIYGGSGVGTGYQTPYQVVDSANRLGGLAVPGALYASQNARTISPITAPVDAAVMATDGLVIEWVDRTNGYVYDLYYHK